MHGGSAPPRRKSTIFNVPVGEERYGEIKLRDEAMQVKKTTEPYVRDLGDEYPLGAMDDVALLSATPH